MSRLTFSAKKMHSIRGTRYFYEVIKEIDNTAGFAPETYDANVCDVVVKYVDYAPYIQFSINCPNMILPEELIEIAKCAKTGFVEKDFENVECA